MKHSLKKSEIFGAIFVMVFGTLMHFFYDWSGKNPMHISGNNIRAMLPEDLQESWVVHWRLSSFSTRIWRFSNIQFFGLMLHFFILVWSFAIELLTRLRGKKKYQGQQKYCPGFAWLVLCCHFFIFLFCKWIFEN